ncbi:MAG: hypothetical protein H0U06_04320 [Solirubrobacterales bacterium]|nr:hypothetical protein [Solirubrobacterales bacterium]
MATSWYRCREQYHVDPRLDRAPAASAHDEELAEHTLEHEVVFAHLGGAAASIAPESRRNVPAVRRALGI